MKTKLALLLAYAIISISKPASGQPGSLDSTFDKDGKMTISVINGLISEAYSVAIQANGKIVTAGLSDHAFDNSGPYNFALMRHNKNGRLDKTFGTNGKVITDFGGREVAYAVAIQKDQKIVAAGVTDNRSVKHFALSRYLQNGMPDSAFGVDGKLMTDFGINSEAYAIAIQKDQKIVAAGAVEVASTSDFALARYLHNGRLDKTFGHNGKVITDFGGNEAAYAVAIQPDGRIVVSGYNAIKGDFVLVRYLQNGIPDRAFGLDGKATTHFGIYELARAYSIAIQKDGKIVLAGYVGKNGFAGWRYDFALARYEENGLPDNAFGVNGKVITDIRGDDYGNSVVLQANGKIVVAGYSASASGWNFALARYKQNGTLDNAFGGNGIIITDFGEANTLGRSVAMQEDGRIVVAGAGSLSGQDYFAIARYNGDNTDLANNSDDNISFLQKYENTSANIYLFPNPVKDIVRIENLSSSPKTISIIDIAGRVVQKANTAKNDHSFNVNQLPPWIYFVRINEGEKTTSLKFVKE